MAQRLIQIPRRRLLLISALAVFSVGCCFYTALTAPIGGDYPGPACRGCDYAGPPIEALASGHIDRFFANQPFMGSFTLVVRAPAVAVARSFGAGELAQYRIGCLVCLLLSAGLGWWLVASLRPRGRQWLWVPVFLGLLLSGPLTTRALAFGHPEELVGALLCALAVVLAGRGRPVGAGIALGLAIATKQWALLAVLPAIMACSADRRRLIGAGGAVAAVFILPMLIGAPAQFLAQNLQAGMPSSHHGTFGVTATNIWFPYAKAAGIIVHAGGGTVFYRLSPALNAVTHPVVILLGLGLPIVYWLKGRTLSSERLLLVLALVFLLRCLLDPLTLSYHHLPFFVAILTYEALSRRRIPAISVYTAVAIWALSRWIAPLQEVSTLNRVYLAWALPLTAYLAYRVFAPATRGESAGGGIRSRTATDMALETS